MYNYKHIDTDQIAEVTEGSIDLVEDMVAIFARQVPEYTRQLDFLYKTNDLQAIRKLAHKIKGTVSLLGITKLVTAMKNLENLTIDPAAPKVWEQYIELFKNESILALNELNDYLSRIKT